MDQINNNNWANFIRSSIKLFCMLKIINLAHEIDRNWKIKVIKEIRNYLTLFSDAVIKKFQSNIMILKDEAS